MSKVPKPKSIYVCNSRTIRQAREKKEQTPDLYVELIVTHNCIHHPPQTLNRVMVKSGASPKLDAF